MITWDNFYLFAIPAIILWGAGAALALFHNGRSRAAIYLTLVGTLLFAAYIICFWISLQRPPLRTMGETRLWYSFFMGVSGLVTYIRWKYRWILSFSTVVGGVFALLNMLKPEIHDQTLMPALQSFWFVPHVTVYMFSYSVLGCAFILRQTGIYRRRLPHDRDAHRCYMGKSRMGTLLELGPERDVGGSNMGRVSALHAPAYPAPHRAAHTVRHTHRIVPVVADMLVRSKLHAVRPAERTPVQQNIKQKTHTIEIYKNKMFN